jgi:hypothetical protein
MASKTHLSKTQPSRPVSLSSHAHAPIPTPPGPCCSFETDEIFEPNAHGIKGLFLQNATIPAGTKVAIQYDDIFNGGKKGP